MQKLLTCLDVDVVEASRLRVALRVGGAQPHLVAFAQALLQHEES